MANRHRSVDSDGLEKCNLQAVQISGAPHQTVHLFTSAGIQKSGHLYRISLLLINSPQSAQDVLIKWRVWRRWT